MKLQIVLAALLATSTILILAAPAAEACHAVPGTGEWNRGPAARSEVVGVDSTGVGVYSKARTTNCNGGTYASDCVTRAGPVSTPAATTPEIRVLGTPVVPAQTLAPIPVIGMVSVPVSPTFILACATPTDYGVYVTNVVGDTGTETLLP